jgi:hypothetical protein
LLAQLFQETIDRILEADRSVWKSRLNREREGPGIPRCSGRRRILRASGQTAGRAGYRK